MFEIFVPDMYVKSIYYIDYKKLWKRGIRCLIFDLDNTIVPYYVKTPTKRVKKLFDELKDIGFKVIIISNSTKPRVEKFKNELLVDSCYFALKPRKDKYIKVLKLFKFTSNEVACIGDQLFNDVYAANRMDMFSILVNPLSKKDRTIKFINKVLEKIIYNVLSKNDWLKVGKYYE